MDIGSLLLILALFILVAFYIGRPFIEQNSNSSQVIVENDTHDLSTLMAERDQIIDALRELEFDHAIGKIPEEDYPKQRKAMLDQGALILHEFDLYLDTHDMRLVPVDETLDNKPEAVITAHESNLGEDSIDNVEIQPLNPTEEKITSDPDDELEALIANRKRLRKDKSAGFCYKCGNPVQKTDHFCPKCGATLS